MIIKIAKIKDDCSCSRWNVKNIIHYYKNVMTYKVISRMCPENFLINVFQRHVFLCAVREVPRIYSLLDPFFKRSFHDAPLTFWNGAPSSIREMHTLNRFK